jgi:peroxiredoxin
MPAGLHSRLISAADGRSVAIAGKVATIEQVEASAFATVSKSRRAFPVFRWTLFIPLMLLSLAPSAALAGKFNRVLNVGDKAPAFASLKNVDGKRHGLADFKRAKLLVVAFICNHCPTAKLYEPRMIAFQKKYAAKGVQFVAISSSRFPADGFKQMQARAKKSGYRFPYLHDPTQTTGRAYGATNTPHFFVLDGKRRIAYMGAFDDNQVLAKVEVHYVTDAVDALLKGKTPEVAETRQFGCEIEYETK